jgi:branched-chain amino acid transport system ATP-binding protein
VNTPILTVSGVRVSYGRIEAVRGADLTVGSGEFVGVIGSNGAGKSSLLRAIAGVLKPAAGRVTFDGCDVTGLPSHRLVARGLALVPEGRMIFADQTVWENLLLGGYSRLRRDRQRLGAERERILDLFPRSCASGCRRRPEHSRAASSKCWRSPVACCPAHVCW